MVTMKQVSVFATKLSPDLDVETHLRSPYEGDHLVKKLCREVSCERIASVNARYASFKISAYAGTLTECIT